MTSSEYRAYKRKLEEHGYTYYPNEPYDGWNQWRKFYQWDMDLEAKVYIQVFDHTKHNGPISCLVEGMLEWKSEGVSIRQKANFGYDTDLDFVDRKMKEFIDRWKNERMLE